MPHVKPEIDKMRIFSYGAGAVGGVLGGLLALSGTPVVMVGRPQNVTAIRENGLKLITAAGTHIVQLAAVTSPDQIEFSADDVVFLCVKGQDTDSAMRDLFALVKDVPVFASRTGCVMRKSPANIIRGFTA